MKDNERKQRVLNEAYYMLETESTVRQVAKEFGISKSTVHWDFTNFLDGINYSLYLSVQEILQKNKRERNIRGGNATKRKYQNSKLGIK